MIRTNPVYCAAGAWHYIFLKLRQKRYSSVFFWNNFSSHGVQISGGMETACYNKIWEKLFYCLNFLKRFFQKYFFPCIIFHSLLFKKFFQKSLGGIAFNVPAVYDGLTARIRALRSKDQGWQTVGVVSRGNEAKRNDLGERNPEPLLRRSVNSPVMRS
ncbi:MAG: hypothetical protein LBP76_10940, partial [Treponema sp.]|nr:hypothetical protein [Treponema sp.]